MTATDWISALSIIALILAIIALVYLLIVLFRTNRVVGRFDRLTDSFHGFVSEVVPAIVNMGTISAAIHSVLKSLTDEHKKNQKKS